MARLYPAVFLAILLPGLSCMYNASVPRMKPPPRPMTATAPAPEPVKSAEGMHLRINLVGYLPQDPKVAIAFSNEPAGGQFTLIDEDSGDLVLAGDPQPVDAGWGNFAHYYRLDFSDIDAPGTYRLQLNGDQSPPVRIGADLYAGPHEGLLEFMRQQRCGYNPFLDVACHQKDGRTAFGPLPAGSFIDAAGGWHDAGDQLKYLLTGSNATAGMLLAHEREPDAWADNFDDMGRQRSNGVADVLDEAKWGLDWMLKLHPAPDHLYHQVADDRDHIGWKLPTEDASDYGWGPNSYRVVYFATGQPQGLTEYQSESDGLANLAGRYAAAMAMASEAWKEHDPAFAARCLQAGREVYAMGKAKEGVQQGNSYKAPYRYAEITWADDMEWGAAELYKATGEDAYLEDAKRYAQEIADTSWIPLETADHYAYYPFLNVGHAALYPHVEEDFKETLAGYYRAGLEQAVARGGENPFEIGVPFIWCSNNLASALLTQGLLYEQMTGDDMFHDFMVAQRDWLLGRNPWGTSMFTGIPADGETPVDIHTSIWMLTRRPTPGGLVDGPVYRSVYESLLGLRLEEPDEFAPFQTEHVVYHDDNGDYSTNEPTMDGTAGAVYWMGHFASP